MTTSVSQPRRGYMAVAPLTPDRCRVKQIAAAVVITTKRGFRFIDQSFHSLVIVSKPSCRRCLHHYRPWCNQRQVRYHLVDNRATSLAEDEDVALSTGQSHIDVAFASKVGLDVLAATEGDGNEQGWTTCWWCGVFDDRLVKGYLSSLENVFVANTKISKTQQPFPIDAKCC